MLISLIGHSEKADACSTQLLRNLKIAALSSYWEELYHIHLCVPSTKLQRENRVSDQQTIVDSFLQILVDLPLPLLLHNSYFVI